MKNILLLLTILIASILISACGDEGAFRDAPDTLHPQEAAALRAHTIINNALLPDTLLSPLAEKIMRSTVYIIADTAEGMFQGSGFVVAPGLVATAAHIVGNPTELNKVWIQPMLSDTYFSATTVYASDLSNDLMLFSVPDCALPALKLADSDRVYVGQTIAIVSAPKGLKGTFGLGIVAGKRQNVGVDLQHKVFQIDCAGARGSSGSPVVNMNAEVIAITSFELDTTPLWGFATPSNALRDLLSDATLPPAQATTR